MKKMWISRIKMSLSNVALVVILSLTGCKMSKGTVVKTEKRLANRVIVIGLDGLSVPGYKLAKHPNLDMLMENGVLSLETRTVMPSVTLPNWTSHLTSSGPEQHGVNSNGWTLNKFKLPAIETDNEGYYPSIFKVLKEKVTNMKTAYYYNWGNLINPINQKYLDEINFQKNDAYHENYEKAFQFAKTNKKDPSLIFLYSVHTDHAGHKYHWMSSEYITAIEEADKAIGDLVKNLKSAGLYKDTHFLLITDHGGDKKTGHGGMSVDEMTVPWAVTGPGIRKGEMLKEPNNNTNTAAVILRLFGFSEMPKAWVGEVPESIFK